MLEVPLLPIANQTMTVDLDAGQFTLTIREATGVMVADVTLDGGVIVSGTRILAGEPIIPYAYLQQGNFVLFTLNDDLPYWDQFGEAQHLVYLTNAEMA